MNEMTSHRRRTIAIGGGTVLAAATVLLGGGLMLGGHDSGTRAAAHTAAGVAKGRQADFADAGAQCKAFHDQVIRREKGIDEAVGLACDREEGAGGQVTGPGGNVSTTCDLMNKVLFVYGPNTFPTVGLEIRCAEEQAGDPKLVPGGDYRKTSLCHGASVARDGGREIQQDVAQLCLDSAK